MSYKLLMKPLRVEVLELLAGGKWPGTVIAPIVVEQGVLGIVSEELKAIRIVTIVDTIEVVRAVITEKIRDRPVKVSYIKMQSIQSIRLSISTSLS